MKIKFKNPKIKITSDGLVLQIPIKKGIDFKPDKDYTADIKEYRKKRSLNANAYAWELINALAVKLNLPSDEIYRQYIKDVGVYRVMEINEGALNTFKTAWQNNGTGWICEKVDLCQHDGFVLIKAYYGSSCYNTKQMSRLIDAIVQDCKQLEIETLPPEKLSLLKEKWTNKENK